MDIVAFLHACLLFFGLVLVLERTLAVAVAGSRCGLGPASAAAGLAGSRAV